MDNSPLCGDLVDQLFHYLTKYLMSCFLSGRQVHEEAGSLPRKMINYHLVLATRAQWTQGCQELRGRVTRNEGKWLLTTTWELFTFGLHYPGGSLRASVSFVTFQMKCCFKTIRHYLVLCYTCHGQIKNKSWGRTGQWKQTHSLRNQMTGGSEGEGRLPRGLEGAPGLSWEGGALAKKTALNVAPWCGASPSKTQKNQNNNNSNDYNHSF